MIYIKYTTRAGTGQQTHNHFWRNNCTKLPGFFGTNVHNTNSVQTAARSALMICFITMYFTGTNSTGYLLLVVAAKWIAVRLTEEQILGSNSLVLPEFPDGADGEEAGDEEEAGDDQQPGIK